MTVTDHAVGSVGAYVAIQLRAALNWRQLSIAALSRRMGKEDSWVRKRATGQYAIALDELPLFAAALDVPVAYFLPHNWLLSS